MMAKINPNQDLIDLQNAAMALGKCGLSYEQAMINIITANEAFEAYSSITNFAVDNKQVLIEDYTRQANI